MPSGPVSNHIRLVVPSKLSVGKKPAVPLRVRLSIVSDTSSMTVTGTVPALMITSSVDLGSPGGSQLRGALHAPSVPPFQFTVAIVRPLLCSELRQQQTVIYEYNIDRIR